ncbi:NADP-dependent oxidoreductase [Lysobacter korlensis]|uniref:NADP-dependent oxidoreductase n=1 Tax=Lysobacter korlensis TaxID=553636 RepID=A0ABV6RYW7_9GAMM
MVRAVRFDRFGNASVLYLAEVPLVEPGAGQVRVRMRAAGLNPVDYKIRRGTSRYRVTPPAPAGRELAGVVDAVGAGVERLDVGDEVFGTIPTGAFADAVTLEETYFARKPDAVPREVAGGLALAGQTAWDALGSQPLRAGQTVVVSAAAGGVGSILVQLAVLRGIRVIGTASDANAEWLRSVGGIPVRYGDGLASRIRDAAEGHPIAAVFDLHGPETIEAALELGVPPEHINTNATDPTAYGIRGVGRGPTSVPTLDRLAELVAEGRLTVPIAAVYPLDRVRSAFERLEQGHLRGKIVLVP